MGPLHVIADTGAAVLRHSHPVQQESSDCCRALPEAAFPEQHNGYATIPAVGPITPMLLHVFPQGQQMCYRIGNRSNKFSTTVRCTQHPPAATCWGRMLPPLILLLLRSLRMSCQACFALFQSSAVLMSCMRLSCACHVATMTRHVLVQL